MKKSIVFLGISLLIVTMVSLIPVSSIAQTAAARRFKTSMAVSLDFGKLDPEQGEDIDLNSFTVEGGVGYFITDMFEVGPELSYSTMEVDFGGGDKLTITPWSLVIKGNAHFSTSTEVTPYVGLRLGVSSLKFEEGNGSKSDTALVYGAQIGMDYMLTKNVSVNPELRYTKTSYEFKGEDIDSDDINLMIGFAYHF